MQELTHRDTVVKYWSLQKVALWLYALTQLRKFGNQHVPAHVIRFATEVGNHKLVRSNAFILMPHLYTAQGTGL